MNIRVNITRPLKFKGTPLPLPTSTPIPSPSASTPLALDANSINPNTTILIVCLSILAFVIFLTVILTVMISKKRKKGTIYSTGTSVDQQEDGTYVVTSIYSLSSYSSPTPQP